jgi:hypothetical protein
MKKIILIVLLFTLHYVSAQEVTIWSEDFQNYVNLSGIAGGSTAGSSQNQNDYPNNISKWTLDVSDAYFLNSSDFILTRGYPNTSDEAKKLTAHDTYNSNSNSKGGKVYFISETIAISKYENVNVSLEGGTSANLETSDFYRCEYNLDNAGGSDWPDFTTNGYKEGSINSSSYDFQISSVSNLNGSTLQIKITANNGDAENEWHLFDDITVKGTPKQLNWVNLQHPSTETVTQGSDFWVFTQVYEPSVTNASTTAAGANIQAWIGISAVNATGVSDFTSANWTWIPATYNVDSGSNDEFKANLGATISALPAGTYYYASRYQFYDNAYQYGGWNSDNGASGKGGFWGGSSSPGGTHVSGVLTLQTPPEIAVTGLGNDILGNSTNTPSTTDGTLFSDVEYSSGNNSQTFIINNYGQANLNITSVTLSNTTDFSITTSPANTVAGSGSTNFVIKFDPTSAGEKTCVVTINNNDSNENPFTFNIKGTGTSTLLDFVNLQSPNTGTIAHGATFNVYAQVEEAGVTPGAGQGAGITCWIGYSMFNTNPNTWTEWYPATHNSAVTGNRDEYMYDLGAELPYGKYYYASRFQYNNGSYFYGGYNGGAWDGTTNVSGNVTVGGDVYSITGDAATGWGNDVDLHTVDGVNYFLTYPLTAAGLKFRKNHNYVSGWGGDTFPVGISDTDSNISVTPAGTYYITFNKNTNAYSFSIVSGCSNITIWTGASWTNGAPDATKVAILAADYNTTSGSIDACAMTVLNPINNTYISNGTYIKSNSMILNNGTIEIANTGTLVQIGETDANVVSTGVYKINKTTGGYKDYDYIYWSSPVADETVGSVFPTTGANPFPNYRYTFNPDQYLDEKKGPGYPQTAESVADGYDDNANDWTSMADAIVMPQGLGFIVMGKGSDIPFSSSHITDDNSGYSIVFEGEKINNGTITAPIKHDLYSGFDANNNNLNLLGNPYPSAIDVFDFYYENQAVINSNFYFWTHDLPIANNFNGPNAYDFSNSSFAISTISGTYPSYSYTRVAGSSTINAPQYIASGQGFLVSGKDENSGTVNVSFKNVMRETNQNTTFLRQVVDIVEQDKVWLNLTGGNNLFRQIAIGFNASTSDEFGMGDAARIDSADDYDLYSILSGVQGHFAIQFLSSFNLDKTVQLGVEILQSGAFQIAIDHTEGIFTQVQAVYLEDKLLNVIHDLGTGAYSFTQTAGNDINDRFELRFTAGALDTEELAMENVTIYPNPSKNIFNISNKGNEMPLITVFDINGKALFQSEQTNQIDLSNFSHGLYFAKLMYSTGQKTFKLFKE